MMRISYTSTCRGCEISRGIIVPSVRRKHTTRTCVNLAPERVAIAPYIESDGEDGRAVGTFSKLTLGILSIIGPSTSSSTACMVLEQLGLDEEQVAWFARHRPELLHATTTEVRLRKRLVGLADLLGCTPTKAASMVQKQPALIDIDSSVIRRRLEGLARTLLLGSVAGGNVTDDGRSRAVRAARRMPLLLASAEHEGAVLESRLRQLAELLHLGDPAEAARLVEAEPLLLVLEPSRIRERIEALPALLDLPQGVRQAELLCAMHPFLLTVSDRSIAGKVNALGAALKLPRGAVLGVVLSYPQVLTFSEQAITGKVVALSEVISLDRLQAMVCDDPSLLARSSDKVLSTLRALQAATGKSMQQAIGLAERRPSILAKSAAAPSRNYRALSVWKLTAGEKDEMLQKHPVLLSMSSREVHLRCRWLRGLVTSNGYYHSGARRIPPALLGVIIMHLPQAWSRLQYLVDCNQEQRVGLMDAVHLSERRFEEAFPQYKRWLQFRTSEMGCKLPWKQARKPKKRYEEAASSSGRSEDDGRDGSSFSWHAAHSTEGIRPDRQAVVSEAGVVYYGRLRVNKPRRLVWASGSDDVEPLASEVGSQEGEEGGS